MNLIFTICSVNYLASAKCIVRKQQCSTLETNLSLNLKT